MRRAAWPLVVALAAAACAPIPAPQVLSEADRISQSPAALDAKEHAAPSWARAEKRRLEAHEALDKGPAARAQFLAEEAIALYNEGIALSRLAKATLREKAHQVEHDTLAAELRELDAQQARASSEVAALEARLAALTALADTTATGAEAEAKRRDGARAFLLQAQLLCAAGRAVGDGGQAGSDAELKKDLDAADAQLVALAAELGDAKKQAPMEAVAKARAACSALLGRARRAGSTKAASLQTGDLLEQLSAMAASSGALMAPERDERGVVVVLRELFDGDSLKPGAKERLAELDRVSAANDRFPIAVVLHSDKPLSAAERQKWQARGASIAGALGAVSKTKKLVFVADDAEPLVGRKSPERALNARVEIVFISPEAL